MSSGRQQPAFNMPSIRAEAILPNPRNPKVMNEMEVIRLQTGCKGAYGRVGLFGGARLPKDLKTRPEFSVFRHLRSMLAQNACRAAVVGWQLQAGMRCRLTARFGVFAAGFWRACG